MKRSQFQWYLIDDDEIMKDRRMGSTRGIRRRWMDRQSEKYLASFRRTVSERTAVIIGH
jgi:hypothetical protein